MICVVLNQNGELIKRDVSYTKTIHNIAEEFYGKQLSQVVKYGMDYYTNEIWYDEVDNSNNIGNLLNSKFIFFTDKSYINQIEFYFKNFKFRVSNDGWLFIFHGGFWCRYQIGITNSDLLFSENEIKVRANLINTKTIISYESEDLTIKIKDKDKGIDFWNGTMPKEIYCDYIKESYYYNWFKQQFK